MTVYSQKPYLLQPVLNFTELRDVVIKSYTDNNPKQMITVYCGDSAGDNLGGLFYFDYDSSLPESNYVIAPNIGNGRWINVNSSGSITPPTDYGQLFISPNGIDYGWYTPVVTDYFGPYLIVFDDNGKIVVV